MAKSSGEVVTSVDRLMDLIDKKKLISVVDAARELSVPRVVIEEWVDFLEEKGIVEVEYKFTTPYIKKKEFTKEEIVQKTKEFSGKKEGFVRKIESSYKSIDNASSVLKGMKDEFGMLSKELEKDIGHVKEDLAMLQNYERLKQNLDKEILESQNLFKADMEKVNNEILGKKNEYELLSKHIKEQELKIDEEIAKAELMKKNEEILKSRAKKIGEEIQKIEEDVSKSHISAAEAKEKLKQLKGLSEKLNESLQFRRNELAPLLKKREEHTKKITEAQKNLIGKIVEKRKNISKDAGAIVKSKLERFFGFKKNLEGELMKVSSDLEQLKAELKQLHDEAKVLSLSSRSSKSRDYIAELEKKYQKTEEKKKIFEGELLKLTAMLKGKK